jgi:hypothetical protein
MRRYTKSVLAFDVDVNSSALRTLRTWSSLPILPVLLMLHQLHHRPSLSPSCLNHSLHENVPFDTSPGLSSHRLVKALGLHRAAWLVFMTVGPHEWNVPSGLGRASAAGSGPRFWSDHGAPTVLGSFPRGPLRRPPSGRLVGRAPNSQAPASRGGSQLRDRSDGLERRARPRPRPSAPPHGGQDAGGTAVSDRR